MNNRAVPKALGTE